MTGRKATTNIIPGDYALSVGMPNKEPQPGWCWFPLNAVATMATGHTPSRKKPEYWGGDIPWISVKNARPYHGNTIIETTECTNELGIEHSAAVVLPKNTVCLSRTGSIGYSVILGRPMATSQGFVNWICSDSLLPRFLQLIFIAENAFLHSISEGVAHTTIYFPEAKAFHVCLPSVEHQKRIVAEIEKQFSRLDEAVTSLKRAKANLKRYKAAVLKAAVEGKLTKEWRKQHPDVEPASELLKRIIAERRRKWEETEFAKMCAKGKVLKECSWGKRYKEPEYIVMNDLPGLPQGWQWASMDQLALKITDGEHLSPKTKPSGVPLLSAKDVRDNGVQFNDAKYVSEDDANSFRTRCAPVFGDVLVVSRGATIGRTCTVNTDTIFCLMGSVILIKPEAILDSGYLVNSLKTTVSHKRLLDTSGATAQQAIYIRDIRSLPIPLPPRDEQRQIQIELEALFAVTGVIETYIDACIIRAERLRQAILSKAFRGNLLSCNVKEEMNVKS